MTTTWGTAHFVSRLAAVTYYEPYGNDAGDVDRKIAAGEIHIGEPSVKPGESLIKVDNGLRYAIQADDAPEAGKAEWRAARAAAYERGEYTMRVPDVTTGGWGIRAWCNWVAFNDPALNGFDNGE